MEMFRQFINQKLKTFIFSLRIDDLGVFGDTITISMFVAGSWWGKLLVHRQVEQLRKMVRNHNLWICFMARHFLTLKIDFQGIFLSGFVLYLFFVLKFGERRESGFCVRATGRRAGHCGSAAKLIFSDVDWLILA